MRLPALTGFLLPSFLLIGCALTDVDVGKGQLETVTVDGVYDLPAAAARAGVTDGKWHLQSGADMKVTRQATSVRMSSSEEVEFFSASQSADLKKELGGRGGAVDAIVLDVLELSISDPATGEDLGPAELGAIVTVDGVSIGPSGWHGRVALSDETKNRILDDIDHARPISVGVAVVLSCAPDRVSELPDQVHIRTTVQPIVVVQALRAL